MENQIVLSLDGKLGASISRGLKWYKEALKAMRKVITSLTDVQLISDEIQAVEGVLRQIKQQQISKPFPRQTVFNEACDPLLIQQTLSDLREHPESVVLGWIEGDRWFEVCYIVDKGYELRIQDNLVSETSDVEVISDLFSSLITSKKVKEAVIA